LFVCVCRALGVPARSVHALSPAPLKPDGASLDASAGLGPDPATWWRHNYISGPNAARRRVSAMMRAAGAHAAAAQQQPRRAAAQPRARPAAPQQQQQQARASGAAAATPMCIDLTGDASDDDHAPSRGAVTPASMPPPPPPVRRRDAELERDTAAALAASASALEDVQPTPASASAASRRGGGGGGSGSAPRATPTGRSSAARGVAAGSAAPVAAAGAAAKTFSASRGVVRHWAEVYVGTPASGGAWAAVLPWDRSAVGAEAVRRCEAGATACSGGASAAAGVLSYVVACVGGGAKDVTQRYAQRWSACAKARTCDAWWDAALAPLRRREAAASAHALALAAGAAPCTDADADAAVAAAAAAAAAEDAAMAAAAGAEALPTRVSDFKCHPLYALARHLTRYQTIHPAARVGALGREGVFRRDAVRELHTADVWQRQHGRRVRDDARAAPAKRVTRRGDAAAAKRAARAAGAPSDDIMDMGGGMFAEDAEPDDDDDQGGGAGGAGGGGGGGEDEEGDVCGDEEGDEDAADEDAKEALALRGRGPVCLYGEWQTEAYEAEVSVDGRVPRNSFGNVDLLRGAQPPRGCVHVSLPRAAQTARQLGIDAPPALVGFDRYAGRQVPVIDGVVVAEEHAEALVSACLAEETARAQRAEARKAAEAAARWRQLLAAIWTRARLEATYGGGGGQGGGAGAGRSTPARHAAPAEPEVVILDDDGDIAPSPPPQEQQRQPAPQPPVEGGVARRLCEGGFKVEVEKM
jgi:xeroderma pigmentosum group C-complementing protein